MVEAVSQTREVKESQTNRENQAYNNVVDLLMQVYSKNNPDQAITAGEVDIRLRKLSDDGKNISLKDAYTILVDYSPYQTGEFVSDKIVDAEAENRLINIFNNNGGQINIPPPPKPFSIEQLDKEHNEKECCKHDEHKPSSINAKPETPVYEKNNGILTSLSNNWNEYVVKPWNAIGRRKTINRLTLGA